MDLPKEFDVIVIGTGLIESIVSAACSRAGKTVFHIDHNHFYGSCWASFDFNDLNAFLNQIKNQEYCEDVIDLESIQSLIPERCRFLPWSSFYQPFSNVEVISYLMDKKENDGDVELKSVDNEEEHASNDTSSESFDSNGSQSAAQPLPEKPDQDGWWSKQHFSSLRKYFNIDLCPRLLYAKGAMVKLLVSSNISRYLSFKNITRLVSVNNWKSVEIPFSRQSVFLSVDISLVEKRLLMKFMQFCAEKDKNIHKLQEFERKPFIELMNDFKLTPFLQNLILDCIVLTNNRNILTEEAIDLVEQFISSTGVYGNTPFMASTHGSGEMQQAFCRLSAVFGATYWLSNSIKGIILPEQPSDESFTSYVSMDSDESLRSASADDLTVVFDNQTINCKYLVSGAASTPVTFVRSQRRMQLSRAILITNKSIKYIADKSMLNRECTQLVFSRSEINPVPVNALEFSSTLFVCPDNLYVLYLWCESYGTSAKNDLLPLVKKMFNFNQKVEKLDDSSDLKPSVLWSCYFNCEYIDCERQMGVTDHHFITSTPSAEIDYDKAIREAKNVFSKMFPDEEFLPRAPNPEEILFDEPIVEDLQNGDH